MKLKTQQQGEFAQIKTDVYKRQIQERYNDIMKNKDYLNKIIKDNGEKASYYATKTLRKVQHKVGFPDRIR